MKYFKGQILTETASGKEIKVTDVKKHAEYGLIIKATWCSFGGLQDTTWTKRYLDKCFTYKIIDKFKELIEANKE